jgi:hypothetical protein
MWFLIFSILILPPARPVGPEIWGGGSVAVKLPPAQPVGPERDGMHSCLARR